jgi:hypothetical protein
MHMLFSLMPVGRKHWSEIYLDGKDEIALLLVPVTKKKEVGTVVAILSRVPVENRKSTYHNRLSSQSGRKLLTHSNFYFFTCLGFLFFFPTVANEIVNSHNTMANQYYPKWDSILAGDLVETVVLVRKRTLAEDDDDPLYQLSEAGWAATKDALEKLYQLPM